MTVLILGWEGDAHVQSVCKQLSRLGAEFCVFRFDDLLTSKLQFSVTQCSSSCVLELPSGATLDLARVEAVWFRRAGRVTYSGLPEPWMNSMIELEGSAALAGILRSLDCLFVNHPGRDYDCSFKLWQLQMARHVGLVAPKTIVTNIPEIVKDFHEQCGGQVIYKMIAESSRLKFPLLESSGFNLPTMQLKEDDLAHLNQIRVVPHLFQELIDKDFDIRVTAIGQKLFPVKIESQAGKGKVDFRLELDVPMELIELPAEVSRACLALLKQLGLNYGAIDLCVDKNGRYVFFEINAAGQYLWMEMGIEGLELSLELAKLLIGESEPMVPRASPDAFGQQVVSSRSPASAD